MKKLFFLLFILSVKLSAQTPFDFRGPVRQVYKTGSVNDTTVYKFSADSTLWQTTKSRFKFNKQIHAPLVLMNTDTAASKAYVRSLIGVETDPVWVLAQPYYVTRAELGDTATAIRASGGGSGSTIYASDGVYKDGDTVKLKYTNKLDSALNWLANDNINIIDREDKGLVIEVDTTNKTCNVSLKGGSVGLNTRIESDINKAYIRTSSNYGIRNEISTDTTKTEIQAIGVANTSILVHDTTGAFYTYLPDTSLTTPTHLMTEAQTKREINAVDDWELFGDGIKYKNGNVFVSEFANDEVEDNSMNIESTRIRLFKTTGNELQIDQGGISISNNSAQTYNVDSSGHVSFKGTYASIYRARALGDTTQSIPTGTTPTKVLAFSTNDNYSNCTPDKDNDKITVTKKGRYLANLSLSYASGTATVNWTAYVFVNGVESDAIHLTGYTAMANDKRSTSTSGIIDVQTVPCDVDYRVTHSAGAAVNLIFSYVNLSLTYIGD